MDKVEGVLETDDDDDTVLFIILESCPSLQTLLLLPSHSLSFSPFPFSHHPLNISTQIFLLVIRFFFMSFHNFSSLLLSFLPFLLTYSIPSPPSVPFNFLFCGHRHEANFNFILTVIMALFPSPVPPPPPSLMACNLPHS